MNQSSKKWSCGDRKTLSDIILNASTCPVVVTVLGAKYSIPIKMRLILLVFPLCSCLISSTNGQYFYSSPNLRFTPFAQTPQLFYPEREYQLPPQFYHRDTVSPSQFKTSGAHIQPEPPLFYEPFPQHRILGGHVQPSAPSFLQSQPQYRVPGAHVQPPPPIFFQSPPQYRVPGAHVQPPPPTFYQSPVQTQSADDGYRGFSYHINYDDGAKSSVVFLRGGQDYNITAPQRITIASDSADPQQTSNIQENVRKALDNQNNPQILKHSNLYHTLQSGISTILSEPFVQTGIVHYYEGHSGISTNTDFVQLDGPSQNKESELSTTTESSTQHENIEEYDSVSFETASSLRNAKSLDLNSTEEEKGDEKISSTTEGMTGTTSTAETFSTRNTNFPDYITDQINSSSTASTSEVSSITMMSSEQITTTTMSSGTSTTTSEVSTTGKETER